MAEHRAIGSGDGLPSGFFDEAPARISAPVATPATAEAGAAVAGAIMKTRHYDSARVEDVTGEQRLEQPAVPAALERLTPSQPDAPVQRPAFWGALAFAGLVLFALTVTLAWLAFS